MSRRNWLCPSQNTTLTPLGWLELGNASVGFTVAALFDGLGTEKLAVFTVELITLVPGVVPERINTGEARFGVESCQLAWVPELVKPNC